MPARTSEPGLTEFNGQGKHVHLLVSFPPKVALSRLVDSLKGVSSRRMRQEFPGTGPALLAGEPAMVRVVLRRIGRRRTDQRPAPVHRPAEPARLTQDEGPSAITTGLKVGALADTG
jgi:hypothetical protein